MIICFIPSVQAYLLIFFLKSKALNSRSHFLWTSSSRISTFCAIRSTVYYLVYAYLFSSYSLSLLVLCSLCAFKVLFDDLIFRHLFTLPLILGEIGHLYVLRIGLHLSTFFRFEHLFLFTRIGWIRAIFWPSEGWGGRSQSHACFDYLDRGLK